MARNERKIWDRMLGAVPEDEQPVTVETQAIDAMRLATDNAALGHVVADLKIRLEHTESRADDAERERDELRVEVDFLRRRMVELDEGRSLSTALQEYRRMVEMDATDQPPPDLFTPERKPYPIYPDDFVEIVGPASNGTGS